MLEDLLKLTAAGLIDDAQVNRGADWIKAMKREWPIAHSIITGLLYQPAESVLDSLAGFNEGFKPLRRNPQAIAYIAALQKKLKGNKP